MFDFFKSYIIIACDNYFKIVINVPLKHQLCCNKCIMYVHVIKDGLCMSMKLELGT
jgi:hypothetical protein